MRSDPERSDYVADFRSANESLDRAYLFIDGVVYHRVGVGLNLFERASKATKIKRPRRTKPYRYTLAFEGMKHTVGEGWKA